MNYYNDNDTFCTGWLKSLIKTGIIPSGDVDERSIHDVAESDLKGYTQCHFFAGIGGWSYALRLAGWPADVPVWTGSCPCQPFSLAGLKKGAADQRHLWPEFARLICECEPPVVFGEQVASKLGREWLDAVSLDLEDMGYAVGAADLCAAGVGAPQIRQRLWFVAERMADAISTGLEEWQVKSAREECSPSERSGGVGRVADAPCERWNRSENSTGQARRDGAQDRRSDDIPGPTNGFWRDADWLFCRDGKWRPTQPEIFPLADGVPNRVGILRGAGNAIVPQLAAEFIKAYLGGEL